MAKLDKQRAAYEFLVDHLLSGKPFKLQEFIDASGWTKRSTYATYFQKQFRGLIEPVEGSFRIAPNDDYRVTERFRKFLQWRRFRQHVTQVRPAPGAYESTQSSVLIYDFLMPLTNETELRQTLNALFNREDLLAKLRNIKGSDLKKHFPEYDGGTDESDYDEVLSFIENHFVGYSISHVDGRFRVGGIAGYDEIARLSRRGQPYVIDETTAVTRFIFPYDDDDADELETIRFLFRALFVKAMVEVVENEKEIWMLETGPVRRVHIWRAPDDEEEFDEDEE